MYIIYYEEIDTGIGFYKYQYKKSLKIPKEQSESVYRRRTDNTMAKIKVQKDKQRSTKHTHNFYGI